MSYDHGLVERVRDALARAGMRGYRERSLFGGWGFLEGKSVFAVAWDEGFVVKMAPDEYQAALQFIGVTPFAPMGERAMTTWVVVNDEGTADDNDLVEWVERALRGVRAAPLKRSSRAVVAKKPAAKRPVPKGDATRAAKKRRVTERVASSRKPAGSRRKKQR